MPPTFPKLIEVDARHGVTIDGIEFPYLVQEAHVDVVPGQPVLVTLVLVADEATVK